MDNNPKNRNKPKDNPFDLLNFFRESDNSEKYSVISSISDTFNAIKNNFSGYVVSTVLSYILAGIPLVISLSLFFSSLLTHFSSNVTFWAVLIIEFSVLLVVLSFTTGFILGTMSIALVSGSKNHKKSIGSTLSESLSATNRVAGSLLLVYALLLPIVVGLVSMSVALSAHNPALGGLLDILALAWIMTVLIKCILAPYVALFQPEVSIRNTLVSSDQLLVKDGRLFVIKAFFLFAFSGAVVYLIFFPKGSAAKVSLTANLLYTLVSVIIYAIFNGMIVMFYRNRQTVKSRN